MAYILSTEQDGTQSVCFQLHNFYFCVAQVTSRLNKTGDLMMGLGSQESPEYVFFRNEYRINGDSTPFGQMT